MRFYSPALLKLQVSYCLVSSTDSHLTYSLTQNVGPTTLSSGTGTQSVPSWLELELARAKKLELGWLGSARRQGQNPSLARLGLKRIFNFRAELGSGLLEVKIWSLTP